jgi:hypothetical protein
MDTKFEGNKYVGNVIAGLNKLSEKDFGSDMIIRIIPR